MLTDNAFNELVQHQEYCNATIHKSFIDCSWHKENVERQEGNSNQKQSFIEVYFLHQIQWYNILHENKSNKKSNRRLHYNPQ